MAQTRAKTTVRAAVDAELRKLKATDSVEGRQAQKLASLIDSMRSARDAAATSRELGDLMERIRAAASAKDRSNPLHKIAAARAARRATVVTLEDERERRRSSGQ